ncbi:MAG TPA: hypothetical protein PKK00_07760 [Bacteroidales bacterium]|nr:hypothetical protein [Bacteroidales bacterium]HPS15848.1 hypothetical protein [Bacteroidales bacterium]
METIENKPETPEKKSNKKFYSILLIVMGLLIAVLVWQLIVTKTRVNTITIEKENQTSSLQHELDSLLTEHEKVKNENSIVSGKLVEKDSMIAAKAEEIKNLINSQADYNKIKKKLDYLRGITQGYVAQIDSLYTVNKILKEENKDIKTKFESEQAKTSELSKDKENLSQKVTKGSTLKAYNIRGIPVQIRSDGKKEDIIDKAKKTDRIKVSFTLGENLIASSGTKTIYVRIARPDEKILTIADDDEHSFTYNGEKIQYSIKSDIDYQNQATDIVVYWDKTEEFSVGTYVVSVFTDGYLIGESQFILK